MRGAGQHENIVHGTWHKQSLFINFVVQNYILIFFCSKNYDRKTRPAGESAAQLAPSYKDLKRFKNI